MEPAANVIRKLGFYTEQKDWVESAMKQNKQSMSNAIITKPAVLAQIMNKLKPETLGLGNETYANDELRSVFQPQFYQATSTHAYVGPCMYCLSEARLTLEGIEFYAGIAPDEVQGDTFAKKRRKSKRWRVQRSWTW